MSITRVESTRRGKEYAQDVVENLSKEKAGMGSFWVVRIIQNVDIQKILGELMKLIYANGKMEEFQCQYNIDYNRRVVEIITGLNKKRITIPFEQILKIVR